MQIYIIMKRLIIIAFYIVINCNNAFAMIEGLYCGKLNCYDVLETNRDASKNEISKSYRQLARKFHPDMHHDPISKKEAEEKFKQIATAYETAIKYFLTVPKYRNKALDVAKRDGLLETTKKSRKKTKSEMKEEEEMIIRKVLEDNLDIRGGYAKPSIYDILWIQLVILPYTAFLYLKWYGSWIIKFNVKKLPYGKEEKEYLIRKNLKMGQLQYDALDEDEKLQYLKSELWIRSKYLEWQKQKEEDLKKQLAESAKYKAYRRYMKNHGTGRITFDD
ncbi:hypothetical protein B566_EDAN006987 [Ephemera danica]|nr:hypothetical protein B566_EDAN006987 [Ephemera danica]